MGIDQRKAGILLTYLTEGVKLLTVMVYTPVLLRLLGQSEYGLYQLVTSLVSYLSLLNFGFGSAYIRYYTRCRAKEDASAVAGLNGLFLLIFGCISLLCILCGGVMTANAGALFGTGLTSAELEKAKKLMPVLVAAMAMVFPNSLFSGYAAAHERFVFQKLLNLLQSILSPLLAVPLLLAGWGSMGIAAVSAALTGAVLFSNVYVCRRKLGMTFSFRALPVSALREMGVFTFFIFADQIINQINWSVDKLLLGRMCGTAAVAVYGIGGQINSLFIQLSTAVSGVFTPEVHRLAAREDHSAALTGLMIRVGRFQFLIVGLVFSGFGIFGKTFIRLWAGDGYEQAYWVGLVLMLSMFVPLIQTVGIEILRAENKHRFRAVVFLLLMIGNILLSIRLIPRYGSVGAALGTLATLIIGDVVIMNRYYHCTVGLDMAAFWKEMSGLLMPMLLSGGVGLILGPAVQGGGWAVLLAGIGGYTAVYCALMWRMGMKEQEKNLVRHLLKDVGGIAKWKSG